ncbi:MAG TPA: sxtJ [Leucothrix sp.]|nr:sxtJ [Leucothrix sp.]
MKNSNTDVVTTDASKQELRKFGFIMGAMFALLFGLLFPWFFDKTMENWPIWPFIVLAVFWGLALFVPQILKPVNEIWLKIGNVLGWINSRIILGIMFFALIFPIGLILKIFGKDSMNRKFNESLKSYRRNTKPRKKEHLDRPF